MELQSVVHTMKMKKFIAQSYEAQNNRLCLQCVKTEDFFESAQVEMTICWSGVFFFRILVERTSPATLTQRMIFTTGLLNA